MAHLGSLKSRARHLTLGKETATNSVIPMGFWWAEGDTALEQDWALGNFETWIDQRLRIIALGVEFDFFDLRDALPPERAAIVTRQLSISGNEDWVPAIAARKFMYEDLGRPITQAGSLLMEQCRLGFVAARAVLWQQTAPDNEAKSWEIEERERDIPTWFWSAFCDADSSSQDWASGKFAGRGIGPKGRSWITLSGVHFSRASLELMQNKKPVPTAAKSSTAGRPPAAFWDSLWNYVWGRIYSGDFNPARQAEVEKLMLDWAAKEGHELSPTAARERARMFWGTFKS